MQVIAHLAPPLAPPLSGPKKLRRRGFLDLGLRGSGLQTISLSLWPQPLDQCIDPLTFPALGRDSFRYHSDTYDHKMCETRAEATGVRKAPMNLHGAIVLTGAAKSSPLSNADFL